MAHTFMVQITVEDNHTPISEGETKTRWIEKKVMDVLNEKHEWSFTQYVTVPEVKRLIADQVNKIVSVRRQ
jgi:hypothetical protein